MKKHFHYERNFLNLYGHHSSASMVCYLEKNNESWGGPYYSNYKITDCENQVALAIDLESEEELDNTLYKLKMIEDMTRDFRKSLESIREDIREYELKSKEDKS